MATIRLIPSTYYLSSSSYLSISDANNMYANTDSTNYATITHTRASTSKVYYVYLRGFNFDDVPSNATVTSFTIKIKANATGHTTSTSTSYYMSLYDDTTAIENTMASGTLSSTVTTFTFDNNSISWNDLKSYGSNFGIRVPLRRASSNTEDVVMIYGAEIEVTYTTEQQKTIYVKENGTWKQYSKVYAKVNGSWIEQTDLSNVFNVNTKYMKLEGETEEYVEYPVMEMGDISRAGVLSDSDSYCRTKDFVYVNGKTSLTLTNSKDVVTRLLCYDENYNIIQSWNDEYSYAHVADGGTIRLPSGSYYIKCRFSSTEVSPLRIEYN